MSVMHSGKAWYLGAAFALLLAAGCGSDDSSGSGSGGTAGASTGGTGTGGSGTGGTGTGGSGTGGTGTGGSGTGGTGTGGSGTGGTGTGGSGTGGSSSDPFAAARQTCIDHINELRAGKGRAPYTRWTAIETCVDEQATFDSANGPHAAFVGGKNCGASAQGECPGQGPTSVTGCIDLMWAEKDQSICSGCDACPSMADGWAGKCANCKVTTSNPTCGHYLALVTSSHTMAACGFSTAKPYMAIDYK